MIDNKTPMMFDLILLKGERNITTGEERKTKKRERENTNNRSVQGQYKHLLRSLLRPGLRIDGICD